MNKPLEGVRVIEMGTHVAVPKAARMMADWGAEVIKVEPPKGEAWRTIGRAWQLPYQSDNNPVFQPENANKKSISIDMKTEEGKNIMHDLLSTADVFITNTRLKALKGLEMDYDAIKVKFPKLIYAHFTGFGDVGPDKDRAGFDTAAFWARSGALVDWSIKEGTPFKPQPGFGDGATGSILLSGILAALYKREKTGTGEKISISLYGSALWYNSTGIIMGQPQYGHIFPKSRYAAFSPFTPLYKTKDGDWILVSEANWEGRHADVMNLLGIPQYVGDERFSTIGAVRKNIVEAIKIFDEAYAQCETSHILDGLAKLDIVHEKLANPNDVYKDEQALANGYLRNITLENGDIVVLPTNPVKFDSVDEVDFNLAPQLGQDTINILKELGYSEEKINKIIENKIAIKK
nr:CoA transferase [Sedimentibacter sp.]